ncbi:Acid_phosphat_B domain-containing protein [Cephalotus follicularis]|uniref:Acid_phosphat_B domain-containing protein n=1 Tax=Cephalotus follicularis TaxID=3775 RepID=A0A1Q3D0H1_CEPFO|nr:Acid_phosphat_B domain-containing protein [Cephalotus follicularis]
MALHLLLPLSLSLICATSSQSIVQVTTSVDHKIRIDDNLYCDSWRFSVETNDAGLWQKIPSRCQMFVQDYMEGARYRSDLESVASFSLAFAKTIKIGPDGKDAWIFDIDETLLSNLPYYQLHGFGSETFDEASFNQWVDLAVAPALPASLNLYNQLKLLGFKVVLLTGRSEAQRNVTGKNLLYAGYRDWERLFLRGLSDKGKPATVYKSEKRQELVNKGYRIHGSSGDQWSDLMGFAIAERSFKLPNPMYYIA